MSNCISDRLLDAPLLDLGGGAAWTVGDACMGTAIYGQTGAGKTTGSGQSIARAFLRAGFGGLVLCAKRDERALWERYAAETGRAHHLVIFEPGGPFAFNFLAYECARGRGGGYTENIVTLLEEVVNLGGDRGPQVNEPFWSRALKQLLRNAVEVVSAATGTVTLADLFQLVTDAPQTPDEVHDTRWQSASACYRLLEQAHDRCARGEPAAARQQDFEHAARYWLSEFSRLADRTRSIIVSMFTGMADGFMRAPMRALFCERTTVVPELTHEGAIIVVDLNRAEFGELGRMAQIIWKLLWQQSIERRNTALHPVPAFLWADEAQFFATKGDAAFQTTARAARACTVYLSQNRPNYIEAMGSEHRVDSLMGNMATKVFHANTDHVTNQWAADLVARAAQHRASIGRDDNAAAQNGGGRGNVNLSESVEYQLLPEAFTRLGQGGRRGRGIVRGYWFQGGRVFDDGKTFLPVEFVQ